MVNKKNSWTVCVMVRQSNLPDMVNNLTRLPFNMFTNANGKLSRWILVMVNPKLNFRNFLLLSRVGIFKQNIGSRMKLYMVQTTDALMIVTSRIDEPTIANLEAKSLLSCVAATHAMNSSPARHVSNDQDHPVKDK